MTSSMVGCFGDCAVGEGEKPRTKSTGMDIVFHHPIMTMHKEKDPTKWYTDMINCLAGLGSDPNQLNEFGQAPLCMASYRAQGLIVEKLLQRENINVNIKGRHGRTPLYLAAEEGHIYIAQLLLLHPDIDVNCRNAPRGATPLMAASRRGHSRVVELLLEHPDIVPDLPDRDGSNALQHARTASVKCKLHSFARSRSLENVIPAGARIATRNICHTSHSSSSSSSSLNSIGESSKRTPARKVSLDQGCIVEGPSTARPARGEQPAAARPARGEQLEQPGVARPARGEQLEQPAAIRPARGQSGPEHQAAPVDIAAGAPVIQEAIADEVISASDVIIGGSPSSGPDMAALISEGCQPPPHAGVHLEDSHGNVSPRSRQVPEIWQPASSANDCLRSAPAVIGADRELPADEWVSVSVEANKRVNQKPESPISSVKSTSGSSIFHSPGRKSRSGSDGSRSPFAAFAKAKNIFSFGE